MRITPIIKVRWYPNIYLILLWKYFNKIKSFLKKEVPASWANPKSAGEYPKDLEQDQLKLNYKN